MKYDTLYSPLHFMLLIVPILWTLLPLLYTTCILTAGRTTMTSMINQFMCKEGVVASPLFYALLYLLGSISTKDFSIVFYALL